MFVLIWQPNPPLPARVCATTVQLQPLILPDRSMNSALYDPLPFNLKTVPAVDQLILKGKALPIAVNHCDVVRANGGCMLEKTERGTT